MSRRDQPHEFVVCGGIVVQGLDVLSDCDVLDRVCGVELAPIPHNRHNGLDSKGEPTASINRWVGTNYARRCVSDLSRNSRRDGVPDTVSTPIPFTVSSSMRQTSPHTVSRVPNDDGRISWRIHPFSASSDLIQEKIVCIHVRYITQGRWSTS